MLIESWYEDETKGGIGHYRLLTGYDDAQQQWIAYDSLDAANLIPGDAYAGIHMPYGRADALWKVFNRTYVLVYPPDRTPVVQGILGAASAPDAMWQAAVDQAQQEVAADPNDLFSWFNLGSSLSAMGSYAEAATAFDRARAIGCPRACSGTSSSRLRPIWRWDAPPMSWRWPMRRWRLQRASRKFIIGAGGRWPRWARSRRRAAHSSSPWH